MKKHMYLVLLATPAVLIIIWAISAMFPTHFYSPDDLCKDHQGIKSCRQCHIPFKGAVSRLCSTSDCHETYKLSQFHNKQLFDLHISYTKDCLSCHTEHKGIAGKITTYFDHKAVELNILNNCVTCHKADYQSAHPNKYNTDCRACHISTTEWKIMSFDHNTISSKQGCKECHPMPVDKAHQSFPETCEACHTTKDWESVYINHDTLVSSQACTECHKKPEDNLHATVSGDCISCHNTVKWKPATFTHDNYFPLTGDHYVSCETCHPNGNYKQYTCLNCHEHNTSHIRHEHEEHGIHNYGDCLRCHIFTIHGKRYGASKGEAFEDGYSDDDSS